MKPKRLKFLSKRIFLIFYIFEKRCYLLKKIFFILYIFEKRCYLSKKIFSFLYTFEKRYCLSKRIYFIFYIFEKHCDFSKKSIVSFIPISKNAQKKIFHIKKDFITKKLKNCDVLIVLFVKLNVKRNILLVTRNDFINRRFFKQFIKIFKLFEKFFSIVNNKFTNEIKNVKIIKKNVFFTMPVQKKKKSKSRKI